jgi:hypothetical protein
MKNRTSTSIAVLALIVALGGTALADPIAQVARKIRGKDIAANAITGPKVKNESLTGADVKNLTAGDFQAGALAQATQGPQGAPGVAGKNGVDGKNGQDGAPGQAGPAASSLTHTECNPLNGSGVYVQCGSVTLNLPAAGKVFVMASLSYWISGNQATAGKCRITADGSFATGANDTMNVGYNAANTNNGASLGGAPLGTSLSAVTGTLGAGSHTVGVECSESAVDLRFSDTAVSAIYVGA